MRFLGVGHSCDLGDMYLRLHAAGHEVRVYCRDFAEHGAMERMLTLVSDWREQLAWIREAGADGVLIFETAEHGLEQEELRREGFSVIGGSALGDRLENDRELGQRALAEAGLHPIPTHTFRDFEQAIAFIEAHPARYVFKLNGSETSSWRNYVGMAPDGRDVIALLRGQRARLRAVDVHDASFVLMEHISGVETGIGAYFNGREFLRPACLDWEHKRFFPGNLGELTGEMGTVVTYQGSDRLLDLTLARLTARLRDGGYVGYINLNTIINEAGIWPLELTCRFGYPGFAILDELQNCGWDELFRSMLDRSALRFDTRPGYALGVVLTVPPFPYRYGYKEISRGLPIVVDEQLSDQERERLHWSEVARDEQGQLITSGSIGYVGVATGTGASVHEAQRAAYELAGRVYVPNLRYRTDIGDSHAHAHARLRELGYLPELPNS
jgi:phosphoribosylamine---glycine ligase